MTTDRRDFGGKPSEHRWGWVLLWKIPEFCSVGEQCQIKNSIFRVLGTLRLYCAQPTGNSFTPNQWYRWKAKTLKVCLLLVWRVSDQAFVKYRPWRVPESGHVTITKIKNLHIGTRGKIYWFHKCFSFDLRWKITKLLRENRFRTVASPGACERLAVLNWRSSSIHQSSSLMFFFYFC